MTRIALFLALLANPAAAAQDVDETAAPIVAALDEARQTCADLGAGDLVMRPGAITWVDLEGDGEKNDAVLDFNRMHCTQMFAPWHGSGGSTVRLVLNGALTRGWSGGLWRMTEFNGQPVFLLGRHGTNCDGAGASPCVQAITTDGRRFYAVMHPAMGNE